MNSETCDQLRRDLTRAIDEKGKADSALQEAVAQRDAAVIEKVSAEQSEARAKRDLDSAWAKLFDPLHAALKALPPIANSSIEAREARARFEYLLDEFRRLHNLSRQIAPAPTPIKVVREPSPEEREKAFTDRAEAARLENLEYVRSQPNFVPPSDREHMRERFVPRAPEPAPHVPISGASMPFESWVK